MFQLFKSIFGGVPEPAGRYPDALIAEAVQRAIDATNPRLTLISDVRRRLQPAVVHAIDWVVKLVDTLPAARSAGPAVYGEDPEVTAFFASPEHIREVVSREQHLREYLEVPGNSAPDNVYALLLMQRSEKNVFGIEQVGEMLQREVPQVTVSFGGYRLLDPSDSEPHTRRHIKRRAFDHLLELALRRIGQLGSKRQYQERERLLLRLKLDALTKGGWAFEGEMRGGRLPDTATLESQIENIEADLRDTPWEKGSLDAQLQTLVSVLSEAEHHLWLSETQLVVDRSGVKRAEAGGSLLRLRLTELCNSVGASRTILMVSYPGGELPARKDWLSEAERYLR